MNKELETLESIKRKYIQAISKTKFPSFTEYEQEQFGIIETAFKALEIIKEKDVSMYWLRNSKSVDEYNNFILTDKRQYQKLAQQEYDLLSKVLKHEQH